MKCLSLVKLTHLPVSLRGDFAKKCILKLVEWFSGHRGAIKEIKILIYAKQQTSDSSWDSLRIENKQIKTVQNNSYV